MSHDGLADALAKRLLVDMLVRPCWDFVVTAASMTLIFVISCGTAIRHEYLLSW